MKTVDRVRTVYDGSDGDATKALYADLCRLGSAGHVAMNVFRANKTSARAKVYKGGVRGQGSYRSMAYERKQYSLDQLCEILTKHGTELGIAWGWGRDAAAVGFEDVLFVEIPTGQVSYHTRGRGAGPDYAAGWDGARSASVERVVRWCADLLDNRVSERRTPIAAALQQVEQMSFLQGEG